MFQYNYIGIPYVIGGRDFSGCDCYGLVRLILLHEYNLELPLYSKEFDFYNLKERADIITGHKDLIPAREVFDPQDGDIVLLYYRNYPIHMGLWVNKRIYHTTQKLHSVCDKENGRSLQKYHYREYYRVLHSNYTKESI